MLYTPLTRKALRVCFDAHREQNDKAGAPYVFHPFHLAEQMPDENTTVTALLHDVLEDTEITADMLAEMGFPEPVLTALRLLTRDPETPYDDYIRTLAGNPIARAVKRADLAHNADLSRLEAVTDADLARAEKYRRAAEYLEQAEHPDGNGPDASPAEAGKHTEGEVNH